MRPATWKPFFATALLVTSSGCAFGQRAIKVDWPPAGETLAPPAPPSSPAVTLLAVVDRRPAPRRVVGCVRNSFGMATAEVVTDTNLAAWVTSAVADELSRAGVRLAEDAPGVPLVGVDLLRAHTEAFVSYGGEIVLRAWMRLDDSVVLNTYVRGWGSAGTNWAASEESYRKTLTEAMRSAAKSTAERVAALAREAQVTAEPLSPESSEPSSPSGVTPPGTDPLAPRADAGQTPPPVTEAASNDRSDATSSREDSIARPPIAYGGEDASRTPWPRLRPGLRAVGGLGMAAPDADLEGSGTGFYGAVEYSLFRDSFFTPILYAGGLVANPESDCGAGVSPCHVSARIGFAGAKLRLMAPIPWAGPFFEVGFGGSLGKLSTRVGTAVDATSSGFMYHVPFALGLALGPQHQLEVSFQYLQHPPEKEVSGGVALAFVFPFPGSAQSSPSNAEAQRVPAPPPAPTAPSPEEPADEILHSPPGPAARTEEGDAKQSSPVVAAGVPAEAPAEAPFTKQTAPPLPAEPVPPALQMVGTSPPSAPAAPVSFYLGSSLDFGFRRTFQLKDANGETHYLRSNEGSYFALGATFLRFWDDRLSTRGTVGFKYDSLGASDGTLWYFAFPIELVEQLQLGPLRLGAGASLSLAPRYTGTGKASGMGIPFQASVGGLFEARFVLLSHGAAGRGLGIGPRFLWQRLEVERTGASISANALGISIDYTL